MNRLGLVVAITALGSACHSTPPTLDGTWTNEDVFPKKVVNRGASTGYFAELGTVARWQSSQQVIATWTDREGYTWFKTFDTVTSNTCASGDYCPPVGAKSLMLQKISKSGKTLEFVRVWVDEYDEKKFPTDVKPDLTDLSLAANYRIYQRVGR